MSMMGWLEHNNYAYQIAIVSVPSSGSQLRTKRTKNTPVIHNINKCSVKLFKYIDPVRPLAQNHKNGK